MKRNQGIHLLQRFCRHFLQAVFVQNDVLQGLFDLTEGIRRNVANLKDKQTKCQ
jgi:hypothetical protein